MNQNSMTQEEREMQTELASLLGWTELRVSGLCGLMWGLNPADKKESPVPEWPVDLGAAVGCCYDILSANPAYSLNVYHQNDEVYEGPAVELLNGDSPALDYFGYPPPIMCDRHQDDRLAFAICDVLKTFLSDKNPHDDP